MSRLEKKTWRALFKKRWKTLAYDFKIIEAKKSWSQLVKYRQKMKKINNYLFMLKIFEINKTRKEAAD
jgi:hypothetical protein